jgi:hypothetical protein
MHPTMTKLSDDERLKAVLPPTDDPATLAVREYGADVLSNLKDIVAQYMEMASEKATEAATYSIYNSDHWYLLGVEAGLRSAAKHLADAIENAYVQLEITREDMKTSHKGGPLLQ